MSKPIKTCVLGVGLAGLAFHIPFVLALSDLFELHSVLERNPQSEGGRVKERFGVSTKIHRSLDDVLADREIELIIVGTPNETHYSFTKAALNAGKHVLVDKPVTATTAEARELGELARSKGLVLYAYQNRRWDSDFLALKALLDQPKATPTSIGDLVDFESRFDRYRAALKGTWKDKPKPAAGQTYDLGSHLIDQALALFGRPTKIFAQVENVRGIGSPEVDDTCTIILFYAAGQVSPHPFTVTLKASILSVREPQLRFVIRGTKGTFVKYGVDNQEDTLKAIGGPKEIFDSQYGKEPKSIFGTLEYFGTEDRIQKAAWPSSSPGCYADLFKNLAGVINNREEQQVKWEQATSVIEIIELAHRSSTEGRVLDVPK